MVIDAKYQIPHTRRGTWHLLGHPNNCADVSDHRTLSMDIEQSEAVFSSSPDFQSTLSSQTSLSWVEGTRNCHRCPEPRGGPRGGSAPPQSSGGGLYSPWRHRHAHCWGGSGASGHADEPTRALEGPGSMGPALAWPYHLCSPGRHHSLHNSDRALGLNF